MLFTNKEMMQISFCKYMRVWIQDTLLQKLGVYAPTRNIYKDFVSSFFSLSYSFSSLLCIKYLFFVVLCSHYASVLTNLLGKIVAIVC